MTQARPSLLEVQDVHVRFGGIHALRGVSFDVRPGTICGLIGPNGAGKTTLFNCLSRLYEFSAGDIRFDGRSIRRESVHGVARRGMGRTFQNLAVFQSLSVRQNIMVGAHGRSSSGFLAGALLSPRSQREEARLGQRADELIALLQLEPVAQSPVGALPFGVQKRVELGRALASEPRLLLLDEPAAGLNHEELGSLADTIRRIRDQWAITVLLVEHHMGLVMGISDHVVVLNFGQKIADGPPAQVRNDAQVIAAYLGTGGEPGAARREAA